MEPYTIAPALAKFTDHACCMRLRLRRHPRALARACGLQGTEVGQQMRHGYKEKEEARGPTGRGFRARTSAEECVADPVADPLLSRLGQDLHDGIKATVLWPAG